MSSAVVAEGLSVGYAGKAVVSGIDLELPRGASLALVGTNGSGKSTLLKTIVGLLGPVDGRLQVLGETVARARTRVAYLGQFHASSTVLPLRARDVVLMGRYPRRGLLGRITNEDRAAVVRAMERLEVAHLAGRPLRDLSGGQQQRVHLAQALAKEADLLVLDEPTAGLDAGSVERYARVVADELARGAAVVTATHDIADAARADHVVLLAGRLVASGPPAEVLTAERLLAAFGIALAAVAHEGHHDLVAAESPHAHDHGPAQGHEHGGPHGHA